ncbi:DUF6401 family natural product biosynthesis protein [Paractinoplanes brasiliensis]|uniref:Uncharacterized protein n=1 Tax=Paractinoplanes brasiliensis TaxID=52695 RepID=A0A4R6K2Q6_9ACTN|nr:DUF6401 family natural product biosynthesis protein [Actinoplanes brasiliensis]TDO42441.1 hypothetical protein C8E87_6213 [Actinoplanes brasiliensis]GID29676.1 hypothetical protein Abr02nite_46590 [Actinoplanes brasiliensis]
MTNEFLAFAPISALVPASPATGLLDEMMARVGVDGIVAALADPGLLALVDQHTAAVRDALESAGRDADADGLASYARAIVAGARRMGVALPEPGEAPSAPADWQAANWHLLRLVAICALAEENAIL